MTSSNDWYYMERSDGNDAFIQPFNFVTGIMAFDSYFDDRATATWRWIESEKRQSRRLPLAQVPGDMKSSAVSPRCRSIRTKASVCCTWESDMP